MPSSQGGKGRDHNPYCFTNWLCGGTARGHQLRPQRRLRLQARRSQKPTEVYDIHATILHLLGIDHRS